jgi:hypothetical protein
MAKEIELSTIDLRYEGYRLKNPAAEAQLFMSIMERGIEEPLEGVDSAEGKVLLNGFKRYRCAKKLKIGSVPYVSLGPDEPTGIVAVIRMSTTRVLSILEQARFIDDLRKIHKMKVAEIARMLSRSNGWVSMRLGLVGEMSERVSAQLFSGGFPVYSYMYTIRNFMRMNGVRKQEVDEFVESVSGKKLSIREIERLAEGYFRGPESFRREILDGNIALALDRMREPHANVEGCNESERALLKDLEWVQRNMQRVIGKSDDRRLKSRAFSAQANLLTGGILSRVETFTQALRQIYDRTGTT